MLDLVFVAPFLRAGVLEGEDGGGDGGGGATGNFINLQMGRDGFAWLYTAFSKDAALRTMPQTEARAAKRGLWIDPAPVPPWEFRK
jgi:hypothetical protein